MTRLIAALAAAAGVIVPAPWIWALTGLGLAAQLCRRGHWRARLAALAPVVSFALLLAVFEWLARGRLSALPLRAMAVCWLAQAALRGVSPAGWLLRSWAGSVAFRLGLFAAFIEHFTTVFGVEIVRALVAWRLAAPHPWRAGWFHSLVYAVARIFERSLARAERFYAAQWLRGLGE